jgi:hypothetical protein
LKTKIKTQRWDAARSRFYLQSVSISLPNRHQDRKEITQNHLAVHRLERATNLYAVINLDVSNKRSSGHLIKQNSAPFPITRKKTASQYFTSVPRHPSSESVHLCLPASRIIKSVSILFCSGRAALFRQLRPASNATRCGVWRPAVRLRHKEIRIPSRHDYSMLLSEAN